MRAAITEVEKILNERRMIAALQNLIVNGVSFSALWYVEGSPLKFMFSRYPNGLYRVLLKDKNGLFAVFPYTHDCVILTTYNKRSTGLSQKLHYRNNGKEWKKVTPPISVWVKENFFLNDFVLCR